jgi:hypothetical protein
LVTDSTPSSVAAGGGAFLAHVVVKIYSIVDFGFGLAAASTPRIESWRFWWGSPGNEEPCWLLRRAGFSKVNDLVQIVNYLLASLVRFSPAVLGRVGIG